MVNFNAEDLVRRYVSGEPQQALAKALGIGMGTVRKILIEAGVAIRGRTEATRNADQVLTDDLARRYIAGEAARALAEEAGMSPVTFAKRLREAGISVRPKVKSRAIAEGTLDVAALISRYESGESELSLSREFGLSRPAVRRRLLAAGITPRDSSKAMYLRMARMSPEERLALASASHAAVRGVPQSEEYRCKIAATRQSRPHIVGPGEEILRDWLRDRGLSVTPQMAVGRYNIDLALAESRVAVEVFGGQWHMVGSHAARFRKRCDYLLDRDWIPVIVWITNPYRLSEAVADYVVALHERRGRGEPCRRQEHVIRADGYVASASQINPDNGAIVMGFNPGNKTRRQDGRFG